MIIFSKITKTWKLSTKTSPFHTLAASEPDPLTSLLQLLTFSSETHSPKLTSQIHARAHHVGLTQHPLIAQKLISLYCSFKQLLSSQLVFDSLLVKNSIICNTLLNGYKTSNCYVESFNLFKKMCESCDFLVDEFTASLIIKVIGDYGDVCVGGMVHGFGFKTGIGLDTVVGNALMTMYVKCGFFDYALKVFDEMPHRNASSWNGIVSGFVKVHAEKGVGGVGDYRLWEFVKGMLDEGLKCDAYMVSTLLSVVGDVKGGHSSNVWNYGRELHCYCVRNGLDIGSSTAHDAHLGCCLVDIYSKNGQIGFGRRVFEGLLNKNVFAWTTMINGYVHCGCFDEALSHFREMQWSDKVEPNKVSLVTVLPACNSVSGLIGGKQIHGFAVRRWLNHEVSLSNSLIDTYSKCGSLVYATRVFEHECICKDAVCWTSMISGYGLHGQGQQAVYLFNKMLGYGIQPDSTVVISVLSACRRSGLLNDGIRIYETVVNKYNITISMEMCACVVEMLGQSGQFDRSMDFIKNMPLEPGPSIWGSLVSAAQLHGNSEMTDLAYKSLIKIEPDNPSNYISLSNLYAASKRWDVVAEVRMKMREKGLRKMPGCSWISIHSTTHNFIVADKSHPCSDLIYTVLNELVLSMKRSTSKFEFVYLMEELD